jgi:hypothetical protein
MLTQNDYIKLYLSYVNDFLTVTRFAEYYGISETSATFILEHGRKLHLSR